MQLDNNTIPVLFDNEFIKFVAEDHHIGTVSEAVSESVLNHVHYALRMILLYAKENQIACARTELGIDDIRIALKDLGISEPIGFGFESKYIRRSKHDSKIQLDSSPNAYDVTKLQVEPVDEFFDADVCMTAHWLVIDGVQPAIPENPLKDYNNGMENGEMEQDGPRLANTLLLKDLGKKLPKTEHVQIKTVTTHSVSLEQQIYFKEIMETVMCAEEQKRAAALLALKTDPGLQVLAPRFSNLFAEGVRCNLIQENVAFLIYLMRIMDSLVMNSTINLEKCLHEIVPAITSCLVIRSIGPEGAKDASWTLRDFCGKLLMKILSRYKIPQVRIRILRVFSQIFQQRDPSIPSLYAVVHAIHLFGVEAVENILFPNLAVIKNTLSKSRTAPSRTKTGDDSEAYGKQRLTDLVTRLMKNYANSDRMPEKSIEHCRIVFGPYGDEIYYMISSDADRHPPQYY